MAIYKIASLNYMTAGSNRAFLNMDTVLGYELYKPVVILRNEEPYISAAAVSAYGEFQTVQDNWIGVSNNVSATIVSSYSSLSAVSADWSHISSVLSDIGNFDYISYYWYGLSSLSSILSDIGDLNYLSSYWDSISDDVSAIVVSSYSSLSAISAEWSHISSILSDIGNLDYLSSNWDSISDDVSATVVSSYSSLSAVSADWEGISSILSDIGDLDYLSSHWIGVNGIVSSAIASAYSQLSTVSADWNDISTSLSNIGDLDHISSHWDSISNDVSTTMASTYSSFQRVYDGLDGIENDISIAIASTYSQFSTISSDWNYISSVLSDIGDLDYIRYHWGSISSIISFLSDIGDLDYIRVNWNNVKDEVSSAVLAGLIREMISTPLSVLCSDIVTEQRDGKWLKTEFLAKEFGSSAASPSIDQYTNNAVAALSSSENILLNEQQRYYSELSDGHRRYIRLYPPGSDRQSIEEIENFNKRRMHVNRTFVLDLDLANRRTQEGDDGVDSGLNVMGVLSSVDAGIDVAVDIVYPMYDMIDVHVKAADINGKSALKSFDADVTKKREDIYLPQLKTDPIGYCQIQSNAYMLTEATALEPGMLESSLHQQRLNRDVSRGYTVQIKSNGVKTYIYRKTGGVIDIESLPQANLAGIEYNNMTEFPQNDIKVGYSQGNEYGYIVRGKNAMDSKYNMSFSVSGTNVSAYGCRDYAGIGQFSGNQLYFKFFDGTTYSGISAGSEIQLERVKDSNNSQFPIVPYQKIECAYINKYTSANLHKTRFFSIKMLNTELNQFENINEKDMSPNDRVQKQLYGQIMQDLGNAIREIVQSLQPSHTQLYRVMFDG